MQKTQVNPSLLIKESNDEEKMKKGWNYYIPKGKNGGHLIRMFYVSLFFSFVNDNEKMTINALQIMH
jgi:hypothetical protein